MNVPLRDHRDPLRSYPEAVADIHCAKKRPARGEFGSTSDAHAEIYDSGAILALSNIIDHTERQLHRIAATMFHGCDADDITSALSDIRGVVENLQYKMDERDVQRATTQYRRYLNTSVNP